MKKKGLLIGLLLMAVGFAAVTTTLVINGTSILKKNTDDFKVYYSDALVNGTQDLSVVVDDTHLSFKTTLDTLGQTYVLDYDVTNGSKNYDAKLTMNCVGGNDYLSVTNDFDTENNLEALQTRRGKLTLTLAKSYTGNDLDVEIECTIDADAVERNALGEGEVEKPVSPAQYAIGDEITLAGETFNVISQTSDTVTMLAQYNLGKNYRQTEEFTYKYLFNQSGWEYTPGPKEIDIQQYDGSAKTYVNTYVSYLQTETGDTTISGNLITLAELKTLGCKIRDDYSGSGASGCVDSPNASWLINGQGYWTRSAHAADGEKVWMVYTDGSVRNTYYNDNVGLFAGIRPIITISKDTLNNL